MPHPAHSAFLVLGLVWGANYLFMKWSTDLISPGQTALLRVLFGFLPIAAYAMARGALSRSHLRYVHHFLVMSVLTTSLHYFALASGAALLASGIAGALSGSIPLFALLGAAVVLRERVTLGGGVGVLAGLGGVLLVARPWESGGAVSTVGVLYVLLGAVVFALSIVYAKRFLVGLSIAPSALATYQMGFGLLALFAVTDLEGMSAIAADAKALTGVVVGLGLLGTGVAYILYYVVIEHLGAIAAASSTYLPPVVAMLIGWLVVDEALGVLDAAGTALILAGVLGSTVSMQSLAAGVHEFLDRLFGLLDVGRRPAQPQH